MPFNTQTLARHFARHTSDLPVVLTVGSSDYNGTGGDRTNERVYLDGGGLDNLDYTVWVPKASGMTTPPPLRTLVKVNDIEYRVSRVVKYPDGAGWRIDLQWPDNHT